MRCHRCDPDPGEPVTTQFAAGYRAALADVRREIEALVDGPDAMARVDGLLIGYLSIAHVVAILEQRGTTTTEKNDAR